MASGRRGSVPIVMAQRDVILRARAYALQTRLAAHDPRRNRDRRDAHDALLAAVDHLDAIAYRPPAPGQELDR